MVQFKEYRAVRSLVFVCVMGVAIMGISSCSENEGDDPEEMLTSICETVTAESFESCAEEVSVSASTCILQEVIMENQEGDGEEKYIYSHDGTNYNKIEYSITRDDSVYLSWQMDLEYDAEGKVVRTQKNGFGVANNILETLLTYEEPYVRMQFALYDTLGNYLTDLGTQNSILVPNSPDSVYFLDYSTPDFPEFKYLRGFAGGNNISFYELNEMGACTYADLLWDQTSFTYFDDRPNVFTDYAVRVTTGLETQFWWQSNTNNWIGGFDPRFPEQDESVFCYTFLVNDAGDHWIKSWQGRVYHYDCEG